MVEKTIKVPDTYGFWRCDGKNRKGGLAIWGIMGKYPKDCPHKDYCWRAKSIETRWTVYSKVCGQWNDYHWFWGDVLDREK